MAKKFVDCFMLMGTALSLRGGYKLPEVGRPLLQDVVTTAVNISLSLEEVKIINYNSLEIQLTALLNQKWIDPRLGANVKTRKMAVAAQIWKPKIVNINGANTFLNNEDTVFWRGFGEEGNVLLSEKVNIKTTCTSDYRHFPFDTQTCEVKFGTFRFPQDEVQLLWDSVPLYIKTSLDFNEFNVTSVKTLLQTDIRCSGNFSTAVVQLTFRRHSNHYIQAIMVPSFSLALLNYLPFWFKLNQRSTRLYINMFVFGIMAVFYYVSVLIYATSYMKAIDIFILINGLFGLVTLLETILVDLACSLKESQFHMKLVADSKEYSKLVFWLESLLKLLYPIFYICFVCFYGWIYF